MLNQGLLEPVITSRQFLELVEGVKKGETHLVCGLSGSARSLWAAALAQGLSRPLLLVLGDSLQAREIARDLENFWSGDEVAFLPAREIAEYDVYARSRESDLARLKVLARLWPRPPAVVVTSLEAFAQRLVPAGTFRSSLLRLNKGQRLDWEGQSREVANLGYERVELVEAPGQFSRRGEIFDIFPVNLEFPVRMELFDDEVDSIRFFDPESQRSRETLQTVTIGPARELVLDAQACMNGAVVLRQELAATISKLQKKNPTGASDLVRKVEDCLAVMANGSAEGDRPVVLSQTPERWQAAFYPDCEIITAYFPRPPLVILDEPVSLAETLRRYERDHSNRCLQLLERGVALPCQQVLYANWPTLLKGLSSIPHLYFSLLPRGVPEVEVRGITSVKVKSVPSFLGKSDLLAQEIREWRRRRLSVVLFSGSPERTTHLRAALWENRTEAVPTSQIMEVLPGQVLLLNGSLAQGVELSGAGLVLLGERNIFGESWRFRPVRRRRAEGLKLTSLENLKVGDSVVHVQHGIGRYLGIKELEVGGLRRDYLLIQYAGEDKLYVPTDQADQVQKYIGPEGHQARLNRLGGSEWNRVKTRVKAAVQDLAGDLLKLYAARENIKGQVFGADTPWQQEFEEAFPYQETPDQMRAIQEVKADLMRPRPMDRLLCGDVGYGKTEVALRATFKVVQEGKQVAVLAPTTVLAQQHYKTFKDRFERYPVAIGLLSRFRTVREQAEVVAGLRQGAVDIVIGTHRLLSGDVHFKDLGLLVVDEEQRFGVAHKERVKKLKQNVDVLTLTATPIPRTLHMSMVGLREMSLIETPPEDRHPVQTYVLEWDNDVVRDALARELAREGQAFYIHNRVQDMERTAQIIQQLVPEARVAVAHGQMPEESLEKVMLDFMEGAYHILVCSTIVENGLDIPNVNTLIVEDADRLGLAQLYQLRGRVGRSNRRAYAYLTYHKDKILSQIAAKRLTAVRDFTEFGAGFRIAMRDLEIRGAGNILGAEQHGHILAVGFELYCRLLEEAVQEQKSAIHLEQAGGAGGSPAELADASQTSAQTSAKLSLDLPVDAYITETYMADPGLKMDFYRRLQEAESMAEIDDLEVELRDRFGQLPEGVTNLLTLGRIRALAYQVGVKAVNQERGQVKVVFDLKNPAASALKGEKLLYLARTFPRRISFSAAGGLTMFVRILDLRGSEILKLLEKVFLAISSLSARPASDML